MQTGTSPARKKTILVVEDETFVRQVASEILESAGYLVLQASNATDALLAFKQHDGRVDVLLTDVVMPGKNGRDLACELKAMCPSVRTIFMSGYTDNAVLRHDLQEHNSSYLYKPFSMDRLTSKVREVLEEPEEVI
jgi:DNA-binding NtrC family response regulator